MLQISKLKNIFIIRICKLYRKRFQKRINSCSKNIDFLIVTTTGLGDTLWATPVIRDIYKNNPSKKISILTTSLGKDLLQNSPYIENIFVFDSQKSKIFQFFRILIKFRNIKIENILIFHVSQRLILLICFLLNAKNIISTAGKNKNLDDLLTKKVPFNKNVHEIQRRFDIAKDFINTSNNKSYDFSLDFFPKIEKSPLFKTQSKKLIAIHPGAKDLYKCWPIDRYLQLIKLFVNDPKIDVDIVITGSIQENEMLDFLKTKEKSITCFNNLSIIELASLYKNCDLVITNDTGPMHLANALNTNLIALFSPTNPNICGPKIEKNTMIINYQVNCEKCSFRKCKSIGKCMDQIKEFDVFEKAKLFLK
jgi:ADP-heptose:LPS heptosyltransferase